ncbi:nitrilase family protein [Flavihumibacter sp. UBA7668]|uniref:nitrilase family protein n=1 Tax=Flavihumibacter sp. UBA7668 TaxID=1946542 RepID=UPI0025BB26DF|nr:nitrilase family protein [Flavihumibacter sp. UBA7668]
MSSLTITTIQSALHWEDPETNRRMFEEKMDAVAEKMELVILPEAFTTGFSMNPVKLAEPMNGPTLDWMKRVAARKKIILTGSVFIEEGGQYFNRLLWVLPNGQVGQYDKRHLFAYAGEDKQFSAGHRRLVASVKGWRIFLQICYDLRFPVWSRQQVPSHPPGATGRVPPVGYHPPGQAEYDLLITVANWPERRNQAWKTLLAARAIENQAYVVGVNRVGEDGNGIYHSGDSMILDPLGSHLYLKEHQEDIFTITLEKENLDKIRQQLPFLGDADAFTILNEPTDV